MELRLLGPVEIIVDDGAVVDGGVPQRRAVLAALAVDAGRLVTRQTLIDRVWDQAPPTRVQAAVYAHVTRIRGMLDQIHTAAPHQEPARLTREPGGYVLRIDPYLVDLHRYRRLVDAARSATGQERAASLRRAVALWRGEPLAGIAGGWAARMRQSWTAQRLETVVAWARSEIEIGGAGLVIGPLTELAGEHPLLEPLAEVLMSALAAAGRAVDALDHYATTRRRLAEELGVDPGAELRATHRKILRGAPPAYPAEGTAPHGRPTPVPAQLPGDVPAFTGRAGRLERLNHLLESGENGASTAVAISTVSGTAGIGKTALAVHWAHQVRDRFPDGQLYVNLRGFDPSGQVMTPAEAVCGFLSALGIPPQRVPSTLDAQIGLYRSLIADKRVLIVLDNARDADQVRPLLPATPTAIAVVTSRNRLTSLTVTDGAHPVPLDLLTPADAHQLLARRLGAERIAEDPGATDQIVTACVRLPLALTIAAARAQQTGFPLATLAAELGDAHGRLDALDAGDTTAEVRAVFSWSYATLTSEAARVFRLLSLYPGPDIAAAGAASLADRPLPVARRSLGELVDASLLAEHAPGRYSCHDLLRAYAAELASDTDGGSGRQAARDRLLDHYLRAATEAARRLTPSAPRGADAAPPEPRPNGIPIMTSRERASDWFTSEQPNLVAAVSWAAANDRAEAAFGIPAALHEHLRARGPWTLALQLHQTALAAALRAGDQLAQARALTNLSDTQRLTADYSAATASARRALALFRRIGDRLGQATALDILGRVRYATGDCDAAAASAARAFALFGRLGGAPGQANALTTLGLVRHATGDPVGAAASLGQALDLFRDVEDPDGEAESLNHLGALLLACGAPAAARRRFTAALGIARSIGTPSHEARALEGIGACALRDGDTAEGISHLRQSLAIYRQVNSPNAKHVEATLHAAVR